MNENLYIKNDLEDYATQTDSEEFKPYSTRLSVIEALLPDDAVIESYSTGGYQGTMGFAIVLDGYCWLIKETFGSCSVCDGMLAADDPVEYGRSILRNAYCFDDVHDARLFLVQQKKEGGYAWDEIATEMQELLDELSE